MTDTTSQGHLNWTDEALKLLLIWGGLAAMFVIGVYAILQANYIIFGGAAALLLALACLLTSVRMLAFVWIIGVPTVFVFANNAMQAVPFATAGRIVFFAMLICVIAAMLMRRGSRAPLLSLEGWGLAFLALGSISIAWHAGERPAGKLGPDVALLLQGYATPILGFYIFRRFRWTPNLATALMASLLTAGAVLGAVGGVQVLTGVNALQANWGEVLSAHTGRAYGPFANSTEFGAVCLFATLVGVLLLRRTSDAAVRVLILAMIAMSLVGVVTSQTRAVWLAGLAAFGFLFLGDPKSRRLVVGAAVAGAIALLVYLPSLMSSTVVRERVMEVSPILNRLASGATAVAVISDEPLTGVGWGRDTFETAKHGRYADLGDVSGAWAVNVGPPHNEWLHIAALLGLPGVAILLVAWALLWRGLARATNDRAQPVFNREYATYAQALVVATLVMSLFVDLGFFLYFVAAAWMFAAVAIALSEQHAPIGAVRQRRADAA